MTKHQCELLGRKLGQAVARYVEAHPEDRIRIIREATQHVNEDVVDALHKLPVWWEGDWKKYG